MILYDYVYYNYIIIYKSKYLKNFTKYLLYFRYLKYNKY